MDNKNFDKYTGLSSKHFHEILERSQQFLNNVKDLTTEPISVFSPLPQNALEDLVMIREISENLQKKKEEDVKKAAQFAADEEQRAKEAAEAAKLAAAEEPPVEETEKEN